MSFDTDAAWAYTESVGDERRHAGRNRDQARGKHVSGPRRSHLPAPFVIMVNYTELRDHIKGLGGVVVGYSGGVDSTLVAKAAHDALGERALAVMVDSCLIARCEVAEAEALAAQLGLSFIRISLDPLQIEQVAANPPDRCYHCKLAVFGRLVEIARERGLSRVLDGANADDESDYRPGTAATAQLGVRSPLKELGIAKDRVRAISRELGLSTWDKASSACLASRVPYGTALTPEVLRQVEHAEDALRALDFDQLRVRHHGDIARIEVPPDDIPRLTDEATRCKIVAELRLAGYRYVTVDLMGYRVGSLNEQLRIEN